jgi:hypothetical protein
MGQGKSTYTFSAQRRQISAFCLLALTTEAWQGVEIRRRSAENVYVDLPGPPCHLVGRDFADTMLVMFKVYNTVHYLTNLFLTKCFMTKMFFGQKTQCFIG